jgi:hypothetical protein
MAIVNQQLTIIKLDMLTVPASKSYAITNILVCNNGLATASFDLHLIPQSGSLDNNETRVINNLQLPAGETFTFDSEKIVLEEGDKISFVAEPAVETTVVATTMKAGKTYKIVTTGTTNFTLYGAANSTPGTIFTATGPAIGTGEVTLSGYSTLAATVSYLEV